MSFACMGGFCQIREDCPHYLATHRAEVIERMCDMGQDGEVFRVVVHRPAGSWERPGSAGLMAPAQPFDALLGHS